MYTLKNLHVGVEEGKVREERKEEKLCRRRVEW
jgi:hypothetical protein